MNIKELAHKAGFNDFPNDENGVWIMDGYWDEQLERFAELVAAAALEHERKEAAEHYLKMIRECVADERERCAALIEAVGKQTAAAIRARGDKHD